MLEPWLTLAAARVQGRRAMESLRAVARHHRIQASPGYDEAAAWLANELRSAGLAVEIEHVPADGRTRAFGMPMPEGWACERAVATLIGERGREPLADFEAEPLSLIQRSDSADGIFELVEDEPGAEQPADVRGRIVLTAGPVLHVHARAVVRDGAAGLLSEGRRLLPPVRTREHDPDSLAYTSFWWQEDEPRGWGFVVSPARGAELRHRLAAGEKLSVEVRIVTRRYETTIPLVTAVLPGTWPGEVLLTAHLCHPRPGANDNASGVAAALEAARALASLAADGTLPGERRSIRWLWMPEFTGTYAWLARGSGRAAATAAALNLDMVAAQPAFGSVQMLERAPHFAGSFADDLVARIRAASSGPETDGMRTAEVPYSGGSDHAVWSDPTLGVPCPMLIQWPDRFYHSNLDTPERCDAVSLAHAARIAVIYAASLAVAGADDVTGLIAALVRSTRRALLLALATPEPVRAARAEKLRGELALASLQRLGAGQAADGALARALATGLPDALDELEGFYSAEIEPSLGAGGGVPRAAAILRRPVRLPGATLLPMRTLHSGWRSLDAVAREEFHAREAAFPGGGLAIELAWFACDGVRSVDDITDLVRDEGQPVTARDVESLFEATASLGLSAWQD